MQLGINYDAFYEHDIIRNKMFLRPREQWNSFRFVVGFNWLISLLLCAGIALPAIEFHSSKKK